MYFKVNISSGHLDISGMIHESTFIAIDGFR